MRFSNDNILFFGSLLLGIELVLLGVFNLDLFRVLKKKKNPTRLGRAMIRKHLAWFFAGILLGILQGYSLYALYFRSRITSDFRILFLYTTVVLLGIVLVSIRQMYREYQKAEIQIGSNPVSK